LASVGAARSISVWTVSPRIRPAAASAIMRQFRCPAAFQPCFRVRRSRGAADSRCQPLVAHGLATKSLAPRLMASTATETALGGDDDHGRLGVAVMIRPR
jgi:hypothetical protein